MPDLSPEVVDLVIERYKRLKSPFLVAKELHLEVTQVWEIVEANPDRLAATPQRWDGQGRPELRSFIAATRTSSDRSWDNTDPGVMHARALHEAGTHTMATGRDGRTFFLYAIPQKRVTPRPNYFQPEVY